MYVAQLATANHKTGLLQTRLQDVNIAGHVQVTVRIAGQVIVPTTANI